MKNETAAALFVRTMQARKWINALALCALVLALAGTFSGTVHAADSNTYEMTWWDSFAQWGFYYVQTVAGWFGKCYPGIDGKTCIPV